MNFGNLQAQLDETLAELNKQREELQRVEDDLAKKTASVRSKDRMVTATVRVGGELSKLEFHDDRYRSMPRAELAAAIVKVVTEAQQQLQSEVNETIQPHLGDTAELRKQFRDESPWGDFLAPLLDMQQEAASWLKGSNGNGR
ncbi:YbaB/EbfC DNA-binding family protein [Saccharopolyspora antimicrobica]|uniref:YbaB/EbfC DNA-binding family protein n=1 Tax=Saccharopolyspora antimicrobica TaxID=455193 RepID=A0A1I5K365_9PSEU|nr:YbaB/EbfC family nucleoid-associated protein [Saccharopolyspora antimicrobica]RKT84771.1 YbaB/EbfC DNA-binding family protein [Saccharopolyspora antimicrobica]SFO79447.1 YbaB/EbfC DNA-binding family protein [Saccharopolyspora antimicrobica]